MTKMTYEIYVADKNGQEAGAATAEHYYFGETEKGERYLSPDKGGHHNAGSLLVVGYRSAMKRLQELRTGGDWTCGGDVPVRPHWEMRRYEGAESPEYNLHRMTEELRRQGVVIQD